MNIHKEGHTIIFISILLFTILNVMLWLAGSLPAVRLVVGLLSVFMLAWVVQFFRNPMREVPVNENHVLSGADGNVV